MELLDIYDVQGNRTGRSVERGGPIGKEDRLLIVHVCVMNSRGEMLIQKRQLTKDRYPGCWDLSAGGFALSGEDSAQAALRELAEELGLRVEAEKLRFLLRVPFYFVFDDFYMLRCDLDPDSLELQEEEVSGAAWASWEEIGPMLKGGRFVDYEYELIEKVFALCAEN